MLLTRLSDRRMATKDEDEGEDEDDWDDDSEGCMTGLDHDDEETFRYWQALADQA